MILPLLLATLAGWIQRHQQQVITYLHEEDRILKAQINGRRLHLTDAERRLVALAHPLSHARLLGHYPNRRPSIARGRRVVGGP